MNPPDAGEVGLEHVHGARPQVGEELGVAVDALADRDRQRDAGAQRGVAFDVLRMQRLLEPGEVGAGRGERARVAHRVRQRPRLVCVDAETSVRPDQPPDRRHAGGILGGILLADLDLDPVEAEREQLVDVGEQLPLVEEQVDPAPVGRNRVAVAAEQPVHRQSGVLAGEIPERGVHRGERQLRSPVPLRRSCLPSVSQSRPIASGSSPASMRAQ